MIISFVFYEPFFYILFDILETISLSKVNVMIQLNKVIRAINTIHYLGIFVILLVNNNLYKIELLRQNMCIKDIDIFHKDLFSHYYSGRSDLQLLKHKMSIFTHIEVNPRFSKDPLKVNHNFLFDL